ncbi:hypothetical protein [Mycoplasmopsis cynos]|uniref:hypothetical protein n=1 Tax=Mycoplasmopsis cynos TaxID=171284 RepID=UPI0021FEC656|nr:hypothetical protein [Mycoplasmopsis cynos]UWV77253.1 hypothetical protein NW070_06110 [Mycoplasmopsis cynos]
MVISIDLVINRKVLNGVVRYNGKNYAAFDLENKRVIFPFNSNVSLVHSSDNEIYFKYNGEKYFAKEPSGKYLSFSEMWALERGLDISIPVDYKVSFSLQKKWFIFQNNARIYD